MTDEEIEEMVQWAKSAALCGVFLFAGVAAVFIGFIVVTWIIWHVGWWFVEHSIPASEWAHQRRQQDGF